MDLVLSGEIGGWGWGLSWVDIGLDVAKKTKKKSHEIFHNFSSPRRYFSFLHIFTARMSK